MDASRKEPVQVASGQAADELDRIPFKGESDPVIADANAKEVAGAPEFLEVADCLQFGCRLGLLNCLADAIADILIRDLFEIAREALAKDRPHDRTCRI